MLYSPDFYLLFLRENVSTCSLFLFCPQMPFLQDWTSPFWANSGSDPFWTLPLRHSGAQLTSVFSYPSPPRPYYCILKVAVMLNYKFIYVFSNFFFYLTNGCCFFFFPSHTSYFKFSVNTWVYSRFFCTWMFRCWIYMTIWWLPTNTSAIVMVFRTMRNEPFPCMPYCEIFQTAVIEVPYVTPFITCASGMRWRHCISRGVLFPSTVHPQWFLPVWKTISQSHYF